MNLEQWLALAGKTREWYERLDPIYQKEVKSEIARANRGIKRGIDPERFKGRAQIRAGQINRANTDLTKPVSRTQIANFLIEVNKETPALNVIVTTPNLSLKDKQAAVLDWYDNLNFSQQQAIKRQRGLGIRSGTTGRAVAEIAQQKPPSTTIPGTASLITPQESEDIRARARFIAASVQEASDPLRDLFRPSVFQRVADSDVRAYVLKIQAEALGRSPTEEQIQRGIAAYRSQEENAYRSKVEVDRLEYLRQLAMSTLIRRLSENSSTDPALLKQIFNQHLPGSSDVEANQAIQTAQQVMQQSQGQSLDSLLTPEYLSTLTSQLGAGIFMAPQNIDDQLVGVLPQDEVATNKGGRAFFSELNSLIQGGL